MCKYIYLNHPESPWRKKKGGPATHFPGESAGPQGMGDLRFIRKLCPEKSSINYKFFLENKFAAGKVCFFTGKAGILPVSA